MFSRRVWAHCSVTSCLDVTIKNSLLDQSNRSDHIIRRSIHQAELTDRQNSLNNQHRSPISSRPVRTRRFCRVSEDEQQILAQSLLQTTDLYASCDIHCQLDVTSGGGGVIAADNNYNNYTFYLEAPFKTPEDASQHRGTYLEQQIITKT